MFHLLNDNLKFKIFTIKIYNYNNLLKILNIIIYIIINL